MYPKAIRSGFERSTMWTVREYYLAAFSDLFGLRMIISWGSLLILLWCLALSALVWRARSDGYENRFMSVLLICEGIKASFLISTGILYIRKYEWLQDILWHWTIDIFFIAHITAIILYLCMPIYYRLNRLTFMYKPGLRKHAWYLAPIIGVIIWLTIVQYPEFYVSDATWIVCEKGSTPELQIWFGTEQPWMNDAVTQIGTCSADFETTITTQPSGLWLIVLAAPFVSVLALLFIRSSIKSHLIGENPDINKSLTSRSLYIGFLGKVIGAVFWFSLLIFIFAIHGGQVTFVDETIWRYGDPNGIEKIKYFLWTISLLVTPVAIAFEAMMFVHATLKDTVFGIDNNLRKTFRNALFTGFGVIAFIVGSELMETFVGYGMAGGVIVGISLITIRNPILGILDSVSGRFIPSTHTPEEAAYLDAYTTAMEDQIITPEERKLLDTVAATYGLNAKIIKQLESEYEEMLEEE